MAWTNQQSAALKTVDYWFKNDTATKQVFRFFGYAGTGKTTLAKHLAEGIEGRVIFAAYTGKAAHVLRQKGCPEACTIHSLIYTPKEKSTRDLKKFELDLAMKRQELIAEGFTPEQLANHIDFIRLKNIIDQENKRLKGPAFSLNEESNISKAQLIVIDECSMVDERVGNDLLSFGIPILVLGDPAQLPPVKGAGFFTNTNEPDVMLTDIRRQASDNPIIHLATMVRKGERLSYGTFGESRIIAPGQLTPEEGVLADQVLVGKNATRKGVNMRARSVLGYDKPLPVEYDKLVCLRNNAELGLLNGSIWQTVANKGDVDDKVALSIKSDEVIRPFDVSAHTHFFLDEEKDLPYWERKDAEEFDYGYALTVHKAQGSQWDNVVIVDESQGFRRDASKWLYTAITRSAEKMTIIQ